MFPEYTKLILHKYEEDRKNGTLSLRLTNLTPAKLKEECEAVFSARYNRKDQRTLNAFFGDGINEQEGIRIIRRCETDKFKPLIKYLRRETKNTDDKNVELLAWLIGFMQRPYELGKRYEEVGTDIKNDDAINQNTIKEKEELKIDEQFSNSPEKIISNIKPDINTINKIQFNSKTKTGFIAIIVLMLAGAFTYWLQSNHSKKSDLLSYNREACMYWANDHYEKCSCNEKHGDTLLVALDTMKLLHLKKINRHDTITHNSIGHVWYIKVDNNIEYYTSEGFYPLDPKRKLKPLTDYMIKKYLKPVQ